MYSSDREQFPTNKQREIIMIMYEQSVKQELEQRTSILTSGIDSERELQKYYNLLEEYSSKVVYGLLTLDEAVKGMFRSI